MLEIIVFVCIYGIILSFSKALELDNINEITIYY